MIGALSGGDSIEIIVALKDLSAKGFASVNKNLRDMNTSASIGGSGMRNASKDAKALGKDATAAAEGEGGRGGVGGLASGLLSLGGGPVTIAVAGLALVAGASIELGNTYDKVEQQQRALDIALKDHGENVTALAPKIQDLENQSVAWGFSADDVRAAITKLTQAGLNFDEVQSALPHVMDLARAKNLDLASSTDAYTSSVFGNARALKQYGILLPQVSTSAADVGKAEQAVTKAEAQLKSAQEALTVTEDKLKGKHTLTAAEALKLQNAENKVKTAQDAVKAAQDKLTLAHQGGVNVAQRLQLVNAGLTKAVGDQRGAATEMQVAQANMNDAMENLAVKVGPGLEDLFARLVNGIAKFINIVLQALGVLGQLAAKVGQVGNAIAHSPIGTIAGGVGGVAGGVGGAIGNVGNFVGGLIPHFAGGGIVDRPTLALIGEGGEREYVIPESMMSQVGGAGLHVHFHTAFPPTPEMARDLADSIETELGRRVPLRSTAALLGGIA